MIIVSFGLLYVIDAKKDKPSGIYWVFVFTGLLGASVGSTLDHYLEQINGFTFILQALGSTVLIIITLSWYVLVSKKDFSFTGGFLFVSLIAVIIASISNIF